MRKPIAFLFVALAFSLTAFAQKEKPVEPVTALSYSDSIRVLLTSTRQLDAMAVGDGFASAWNSIGPEQQAQIQKQTKLMKKKGYKLRPHFINYYAAIVAAQTVEKLDQGRFDSFLLMIDKVLAKENSNQANVVFQQARDFFEHHALNFQKFFRLVAIDDDYTLTYFEPKDAAADTVQTVASSSDIDTTAFAAWRQPIAQPDIVGAAIVFSKVSLNFITPFDSVMLKNTKGTFSLRNKLFVGERGQFDWSVAGLSPDSVNYEFSKYNFKTAQPYLRAEQGKLLYQGKFQGRVPGKFEFKSISRKPKAAVVYPRFTSYENNVNILGLGKSIVYQGGFGLIGKSANSLAANGEPAMLEIRGDSNKRFKALASSIAFKDSLINFANANVTIYHGSDSISHPMAQVQYDRAKEKIFISKNRTLMRNAPFSASYFGVDFTADAIQWNLKSDTLNITIEGSGGVSPLVIESLDFYDPYDFETLRGPGLGFNAFFVFIGFAREIKAQDFSVFELVQGNRTIEKVRMAADFLAQKGIILYNPRTGKIHVREKALQLANAKIGKADYDNMKVQSLTDTVANATLSLGKQVMTVRGVEEFNISDSLNVKIKPDSSIITLMQNRDIKFNGTINAGNFEITGKNFTFKYDSFLINLNHIDSIRFYVTEKNGTRRRVNNSLVGSDSTVASGQANSHKKSGTLFINHPDNKSGKAEVPNYPRLDGETGAIVFFDREEVAGGVYDKSIFFAVPPFKIDSLNDADPGSISFHGKFFSNGMFPPFEEKLHTMKDKSLGFNHPLPTDGIQLFKGDGKLFGDLNLDGKGLRATGKIDYLSASLVSEDFAFYPDSVISKGKSGELKGMQIGAVTFPQATFSDYQLRWYPKQDRFRIKNTKEPFSFYDKTAALNGVVNVSKTGVTASGVLSTRGSEVSSKAIAFASNEFDARHARFEVKTATPNKPALRANDVKLKFDLEKNTATINPEVEGVAAFDFPYAQFKTSIPQATWDLKTQKIEMNKAADVPLENSYFYTTRKDLDSLRFNADRAEYDIATQQLKVSGIPYIIVADAKLTPANNEVLISENAKIGQLKNTTIILDTLNGYHRLTKGVVDIISRNEFTGFATYQYVNSVNDTFNIQMTNFHLESVSADVKARKRSSIKATQQTVGSGAVGEAAKVLVAPRIFYKGDMVMYATRPALLLKGFIKLDLKKLKDYKTWIRYEQSGDEKEIFLDFDNALTEEGKRAKAGLHFAQDNSVYITFVSDKKDDYDDDFFLPSGSLFFDKERQQFKIEDRQKTAGEKLSGKVFAYNEDKEEVHFEGPISFFKNTNGFKLTAAAIGSGSLTTNEIKMNTFVMANMAIPDMAFQLMTTNLVEVIKSEGVPEGLGDQTELLYKISNLVGERPAKEFEQKSQKGYVSLGTVPGLLQPLVFSNVNLKWSPDRKAFYSEGTIGLSNSNQRDVNGAFEGFMEIRRAEDGAPVFHVFFKASPESWYYFGFEDNRLMVHSANKPFNDLIAAKTNSGKAKMGDMVFIPGTDEETLAYVNRFRLQYNGIEQPYDLHEGAANVKKKEKKKEDKKDGDGF